MSVDAGFSGELLQQGLGKEALVGLNPVSGYVRGTIYQVALLHLEILVEEAPLRACSGGGTLLPPRVWVGGAQSRLAWL